MVGEDWFLFGQSLPQKKRISVWNPNIPLDSPRLAQIQISVRILGHVTTFAHLLWLNSTEISRNPIACLVRWEGRIGMYLANCISEEVQQLPESEYTPQSSEAGLDPDARLNHGLCCYICPSILAEIN